MSLPIRTRPPPTSTTTPPHFYALIHYDDPYVQPLLLSALSSHFPPSSYTLLPPPLPSDSDDSPPSLSTLLPSPASKILQIAPYETIDFAFASSRSSTCLVNSFVIRKALIRKHYLSATVDAWAAKRPGSALPSHVKRAEAFEVDYAEFLDDALVEAWDLQASMARNEERSDDGEKEWWILKPGMSDRGQGIRLFCGMEGLQGIFDGWERESSDDEEDDEEDLEGGDGIMVSHLRHFVAQPYIHPPLLLDGDRRKFHVRVYVLAVGSLKVYVYRDMLALFAGKDYVAPGGTEEEEDLDAHLTNTCLQGAVPGNRDAVRRFWDLDEEGLKPDMAQSVFAQICEVTGELFEAAARTMMVHFQPREGAFEVYGLDFLVDAGGTAWLLEVNAFPDFKQTGEGLAGVVSGFWEGVVRTAVVPWVMGEEGGAAAGGDGGGAAGGEEGKEDMVLVREVDLGRR